MASIICRVRGKYHTLIYKAAVYVEQRQVYVTGSPGYICQGGMDLVVGTQVRVDPEDDPYHQYTYASGSPHLSDTYTHNKV